MCPLSVSQGAVWFFWISCAMCIAIWMLRSWRWWAYAPLQGSESCVIVLKFQSGMHGDFLFWTKIGTRMCALFVGQIALWLLSMSCAIDDEKDVSSFRVSNCSVIAVNVLCHLLCDWYCKKKEWGTHPCKSIILCKFCVQNRFAAFLVARSVIAVTPQQRAQNLWEYFWWPDSSRVSTWLLSILCPLRILLADCSLMHRDLILADFGQRKSCISWKHCWRPASWRSRCCLFWILMFSFWCRSWCSLKCARTGIPITEAGTLQWQSSTNGWTVSGTLFFAWLQRCGSDLQFLLVRNRWSAFHFATTNAEMQGIWNVTTKMEPIAMHSCVSKCLETHTMHIKSEQDTLPRIDWRAQNEVLLDTSGCTSKVHWTLCPGEYKKSTQDTEKSTQDNEKSTQGRTRHPREYKQSTQGAVPGYCTAQRVMEKIRYRSERNALDSIQDVMMWAISEHSIRCPIPLCRHGPQDDTLPNVATTYVE